MDLQKFRHDFHLSQSNLAEILGCRQSNVSSLENSDKPLAPLYVRILIEKFGYDAVAKYAHPSELLASPLKTPPAQNQMTTDATLVQVMKIQAEQNSALISELSKRSEQMDRLIAILETKK